MKTMTIVFTLLIIICLPSFSQTQITGLVKDARGEPLIGVSVSVKGTNKGTLTDGNGKFSMTLSGNRSDSVLNFTYVGFASQEIAIGTQTHVEITMLEAPLQMNEIVVIGYGVQKKGDLTGAVSVVDGSRLEKIAVIGIDQALQGRAAGVQVSQNSGAPGDGASIRIRGTGSIFSNNDPLYVIDGIPTKDPVVLNSLPASEIESISILKDASSAAIYGSRANNGVVLVTTRKAKKGESKIQFKSQLGFQYHGYLTPMVNKDEYVQIYNEAVNNDNPYLPSVAQRPLISNDLAASLPDVNHMAEIYRKAPIQTYDLSITGGSGKTNYLVAGSYFSLDGIIFNSGYKRATLHANVNSEVKDWLTVSTGLNIYRSSNDIIATTGDGFGGNGSNPVRYAFFRSPAVPTYDSNGNFVDLPGHSEFFGDGYNPLGVAENTHNNRIDNGFSGKFNTIIKFNKNLSLISNFGIDYNNFNKRRFNYNWGTNQRINNPNSLNVENSYAATWTANNVLSYVVKLADAHQFNVTLGEESIKSDSYDASTTVHNFPNQDMNLVYLSNGTGIQVNSEGISGYALQSYFGRVNYDYKGKYLASVVLRQDGSSKFAPKNRWNTFYSGSVGWILSEEPFLKKVKFIERLKLRGGFGINGNQDIPSYAYTDILAAQLNYPFGGTVNNGYGPGTLGNIDLTWETATQYDGGLDLSLWRGMFTITIDYFYKVTHNMLVPHPEPPSVGYASSPWVNNGEILNRGLEVEVEFKHSAGNFNYSISGNIATIHNEVLQLDGVINDNNFGFTRTEKGYPIGSFYMLQMEGIFQNQSDIIKHATQGNTGTGMAGDIRPGDVKYADTKVDGKIDDADRTHVGSAIPSLTGGLNFSCNYKGVDLSIFFQGVYGDKIYYQIATDVEGFYRPFPVTERYFKEHWTGAGSSNTQPIASWSDSQNNTRVSTRFLEDGSYVRLKNLQIGYTIPVKLTTKIHIERLRVYFSGTNLFTVTKYPGLDPEMTTNNNSIGQGADIVRNVDWGTFPSAISYNLGIELTF